MSVRKRRPVTSKAKMMTVTGWRTRRKKRRAGPVLAVGRRKTAYSKEASSKCGS